MLKKIAYGILIIIAIIAIAGVVLWNLPAENVSRKTTDATIDATTLYEAYSSDEKAGNAKYIGKVLVVKGKIEDITTDEKGSKVILIAGSDMGNGVLCTLEPSEADKVASLKIGQEIAIKGRCTGMLMDVVLNNCTIQ